MENHKKNMMFLSLGYLVSAAAAAGGGYYCYEEYKVARDEEASVNKEIELADVKIGQIDDLEVDVICLRENLSHSVRILPNSTEVNQFVDKLSEFATESGCSIRQLDAPIDRSKNKEVFDKMIYKADLVANAHQFHKFLALAEGWERFVRVTKVDVKSGSWEDDMAREEVRHEISVELETYSYLGNDDSAARVAIANYDKRVEQLQDEILLRRSENQVETYQWVENPLRRDIFVDPRRRVADDVQGGWPYADQKAAVDALSQLASDLSNLMIALAAPDVNFIRRLEIETEIDRKLAQIQQDFEKAAQPDAVTDMSLKRRIERDVRPVVQQLTSRDPNVSSQVTEKDLRRFRDDMRALVDEGSYDAALKKHETIKGRIDGKHITTEAAEILQQIDKAAFEAEVALDFQRKDIDVRGAIVSPTGSIVVINGRVLHEGDTLEDDLVVYRIAADRIEFRYRGVVLARSR